MKKKEKLKIDGMTCASCVRTIENSVKRLEGIKSVYVNLATETASIEYEPEKIDIKRIIKTIEDTGYRVLKREEGHEKYLKELKKRVIAGFAGGLALLFMGYSHIFRIHLENFPFFLWIQFLLATPLLIYVATPIFKRAFKSLIKRNLNMDVMYAMGIGSAYASSFLATINVLPREYVFYEAALLLAGFLMLGRFLETKAKGKTSEAIKRLTELQAKFARVLKNGEEKEIPLEEVKAGNLILVKPGEKIPVDGSVIEGESYVDEAMVTGEPVPNLKTKGEKVIGGTINKSGILKIRAEKVGKDTFLAQVIRMVESAMSSKPPIQRVADKIVEYFIPAVLLIATGSYIFWAFFGNPEIMSPRLFAFISFISVLVIACPCAFGLATPTAVVVGMGKGAEMGILIKNGEALEISRKISVVIFDKTGTLTKGKPEVQKVITYGMDKKELLSLAGSLEKNSEHPLAKAVFENAKNLDNEFKEVKNFEEIAGKGVRGIIQDKWILIGKREFLEETGIKIDKDVKRDMEKLESEAKTCLLVAIEGKVKGIIGVSDTIKEGAREALENLKKMGKKIFMITGDSRKTARAIADKLGIDEVIAEVLPEEKARKVKEIREKGERVAFVGDGINDAPALAEADLGIAIGQGTDIAIESAEIVLVKNDLMDVVRVMKLSNKTFLKIKQNIFWALFYNIILIPFAAGLFYALFKIPFRPEWAAGAMALSSFSVVTNSLLLKRYKDEFKRF